MLIDWAAERGFPVSITEVYKHEALPSADSFDWLVIMGGGMSVNDEDMYAWLQPEKQFVKAAIDAGKTVIGICLGSQMIANVLGKKVYKNAAKEIGWYPVSLTKNAPESTAISPQWNNELFFHWHGETFDLPDGAVHLAFSVGCVNQAYRIGQKIWGFQFHPETNYQTLEQMVSSGGRELVKDKYVMTAEEILNAKSQIEITKPLYYGLLDQLAAVALTKA